MKHYIGEGRKQISEIQEKVMYLIHTYNNKTNGERSKTMSLIVTFVGIRISKEFREKKNPYGNNK